MTPITSNETQSLGSGSSSNRNSIPTDQSREGSASSLGLTPMTSNDSISTPSRPSQVVDERVQEEMHNILNQARRKHSGEHGSLVDAKYPRTGGGESPLIFGSITPPTQGLNSNQMHPQMQGVVNGPPGGSATVDTIPLSNTTNNQPFIAAMLPCFLSNFNTDTNTVVNQPTAPIGLYDDAYLRSLLSAEDPSPAHDPDLAFHGRNSSAHDGGATTSHHEVTDEAPPLSRNTFTNPNPFENTSLDASSGKISAAFSPHEPHDLSPVEEHESFSGSDGSTDSSDGYPDISPGSIGAIALADMLAEESSMILEEQSLGAIETVDGVSATTPEEENGLGDMVATESAIPEGYESTRIGEPSASEWVIVLTCDPETRSTIDAINENTDVYAIGGGYRYVEALGAVPDGELVNEGDDRDDCTLPRPPGHSGKGCRVPAFYLAKFKALMDIIMRPERENPSKFDFESKVVDEYPYEKPLKIKGPRHFASDSDATKDSQGDCHFDSASFFDPEKRFTRTTTRPPYGTQKTPDWITELKQALGFLPPLPEWCVSQPAPPAYTPSVPKPLGDTKISVCEVPSDFDDDEDVDENGFLPLTEFKDRKGKGKKSMWRK